MAILAQTKGVRDAIHRGFILGIGWAASREYFMGLTVDQHGFTIGVLYILWKIFDRWHGGGMVAVMTHVTDSLTAIKISIIPILKALVVAFLLIMFMWVPYQRSKEVEIDHARTINDLNASNARKINELNSENAQKINKLQE